MSRSSSSSSASRDRTWPRSSDLSCERRMGGAAAPPWCSHMTSLNTNVPVHAQSVRMVVHT